jgi:hypothetical protein
MQEEFTSMATHSAAMFAADAIGASAII